MSNTTEQQTCDCKECLFDMLMDGLSGQKMFDAMVRGTGRVLVSGRCFLCGKERLGAVDVHNKYLTIVHVCGTPHTDRLMHDAKNMLEDINKSQSIKEWGR